MSGANDRAAIKAAMGRDSDGVMGIHVEFADGDDVLMACFFPVYQEEDITVSMDEVLSNPLVIRKPRAGDPSPYRVQVPPHVAAMVRGR